MQLFSNKDYVQMYLNPLFKYKFYNELIKKLNSGKT
jgi:hypothetical protein